MDIGTRRVRGVPPLLPLNEKIKAIQGIVGTTPDGIWGPKSQAAFDAVIHPPVETGSYSKAFTEFMPWILDWEGRTYEDDPDDPGGATKFGIDQRSHPGVNIHELTEAGAMEIYWDEWVRDGCNGMMSPYAEVYFNCAVNMGTGRAKEFNDAAQGDPKTFLALQEAKYRNIVSNNPVMQKYLKGWLNRSESLRERFSI